MNSILVHPQCGAAARRVRGCRDNCCFVGCHFDRHRPKGTKEQAIRSFRMEEEYAKVLQHFSGVADSIYPPSMLVSIFAVKINFIGADRHSSISETIFSATCIREFWSV